MTRDGEQGEDLKMFTMSSSAGATETKKDKGKWEEKDAVGGRASGRKKEERVEQ